MTLSISYCKCPQKRKFPSYTTQIIVLDLNRQLTTLLTTKTRSNKLFRKFSFQRCVASVWPYVIFFNLIKKSCYPPSFLKYLKILMKTSSPLRMSAWEKSFLKSMILLYKPSIHYKINLTVAHCTSGEYELRGSLDSLVCTYPLTQYHALNFLIV